MRKELPSFIDLNTKDDNSGLMDGVVGFNLPDPRALLWATMGVYFGYPHKEIVAFCDRSGNGGLPPKETPFKGTGYIYAAGDQINKEEHTAEINSRRYHPKGFPDDSGRCFETVKMLLVRDGEFRQSVLNVLLELEWLNE